MANFWLGNIPSGCDYDMQVYRSNDTTLVAASARYSTTPELIKIHVRSGDIYRIKIFSSSGSSTSKYLFRVKRYDLAPAEYYTFNCQDRNTRPSASNSLQYLWNMGFTAEEFLNNSVVSFYSNLPYQNISVVHKNKTLLLPL
ncbi:MAG: hypothetical protein IJ043_00780 [Clostridia bacterium]|nr:hypothetical protein [Clostridia bacterium]